jgi:hyperosmotically inducible periplasmic protein
MKTFIIGVLLGIIIGAGGLWWLQQRRSGALPQTAVEVKKLMDAKLEALDLQADKIRKELAETGRVVRRKASALGEKIADAAADAGTTGAIKAKLAADPDLSALAISVSTTNGVVTLSGKVGSPDLVGKAMLLALETDGVREVTSTLQVAKE